MIGRQHKEHFAGLVVLVQILQQAGHLAVQAHHRVHGLVGVGTVAVPDDVGRRYADAQQIGHVVAAHLLFFQGRAGQVKQVVQRKRRAGEGLVKSLAVGRARLVLARLGVVQLVGKGLAQTLEVCFTGHVVVALERVG